MINPKVTVLMPVYNCELYINEAVDSILTQTFTDFEFLIIDDCSTDKTVFLLNQYNDARIKLILKPSNTGYTNSLNHGLSIARGKYIARMDGDDISLQERFAKQIDFLDNNPDHVLCSAGIKIINSETIYIGLENHDQIKIELLNVNCIAHPAVMFNKSILQQLNFQYNIDKEPAEDYDLWIRLSNVAKLHNLQEVLVHYRVHDSQISRVKKEIQTKSANNSRLMLWNFLNISSDINHFLLKIVAKKDLSEKEIYKFFEIKTKLLSINNNELVFEPQGFMNHLDNLENNYISKYFFYRTEYYPTLFLKYLKIKKNSNFKTSFNNEMKFLIKSFIFWKVKKII